MSINFSSQSSFREFSKNYDALKAKSRENGGDVVPISINGQELGFAAPKDAKKKGSGIGNEAATSQKILFTRSGFQLGHVKNRRELKKFIKDPQFENMISLMESVTPTELKKGNEQTAKAIRQLSNIANHPKTSTAIRNGILQSFDQLVDQLMEQPLDPSNLNEEDIILLNDVAYNPNTPPLRKKAIFQKIYETHKSISSRAMSGVYGISQNIVNTLQEKGSYLVAIPKTIGGSTEERKELSLDDLARDCNPKHPPKIKQAGTWKYFEAPYDPNSIGENSNGNLLAVFNTDPNPSLEDATMEHLIEKSTNMLSELKSPSVTNENLLQIEKDLQEIQTVVNARRTAIDNCTQNLKIINKFKSPTFENPEQKAFSAATVGSGQTLTRARMTLQELDKVLSSCQTALEAKASETKTPSSQESASSTIAAQ